MDEFSTLPPGTLIAGKLRIIRTLGAGGMGVVYEVEHEITKHHRALKVLHAYAAEQPGVVERFLREASAAGRVGNAHVAETFDAGKLDSGEPYLLMELLAGETLDHMLQRTGPLDAGFLADLIHQACEGVQAAHDAGIVHRDLKPDNLMIVTRDGAPFVKILDFGISKFDAERTGSMKLTMEGLVMGTPYYMSPEQVRGASDIDARTDVYALGVILYECATGVRPFEAATVQHLAVLIHEGKPLPLASRRPDLPTTFYDVVSRAMASDRAQRYDSARALADALAPLRRRTSSNPARITAATQPIPPLAAPNAAGMSAAAMSAAAPRPSTTGAVSATTSKPPKSGGLSPAIVISAATLVLAAGAVVFAFTRSGHQQSTPVSAASASPVSATLNLAARPAASVAASPASTPEASGAALHATPATGAMSEAVRQGAPSLTGSSVPSGTPASPVSAPVTVSVSAARPPASSSAHARIEENGLSRENPFR